MIAQLPQMEHKGRLRFFRTSPGALKPRFRIGFENMSDNPRQLWFTPWCRVTAPFTVGPVRFLPGEEALKLASPDVREAALARLGCYRSIDGGALSTPGVLALDDDPFRVLTIAERATLRSAADVAAFLGVASSEDFGSGHEYFNSSHFRLVQQNFTAHSDFIAFGGRRRLGGVSDGGYRLHDVRFHASVEAAQADFAGGAQEFREAINAAWGSPLGGRIRQVAQWFRLATTDSPDSSLDGETKMLSTALELLCKRPAMPARASVAHAIRTVLPADRLTKPCWVGWTQRPNQPPEIKARPDWPLLQFWSNDFFNMRNALEHEGEDSRPQTPAYPSWPMLYSALFGINLLPHLVRGFLAQENMYVWTDDDLGRLDMLIAMLQAPGLRLGHRQDMRACIREAHDIKFRAAMDRLAASYGLGG
jgi:hypothetical protein